MAGIVKGNVEICRFPFLTFCRDCRNLLIRKTHFSCQVATGRICWKESIGKKRFFIYYLMRMGLLLLGRQEKAATARCYPCGTKRGTGATRVAAFLRLL